jgi:hypothetical protein
MKRENRTTVPRRAVTLALTALICAVVCVGCSDDPSVSVSAQCLTLLPSEGTAQGHVISRTGADSTCNFLDVELVATDIQGIRSAEINVSYPNGLTFLLLAEVGELLLGIDGESVACGLALSEYGVFCEVGDDFENGVVELDLSLTSQEEGEWTVDAPAGEGAVLARLTFRQITTLPGAQGPFDFNYGKLLDDGNEGTTAPVAIIDVNVDSSTFVGGQMIIQER